MRRQDDRLELFIFPDGTAVEIIVFAAARGRRGVTEGRPLRGAAPSAATPGREPEPPKPDGQRVTSAPSMCPACGSELVYPVDWQRNCDGDWNLRLRCPNCEAQRRIVLGREGVEDLNRTLYRLTCALAREADTVSRRNFEEEAAKLVEALTLDLILPMDF
jgi:hypothetical protein